MKMMRVGGGCGRETTARNAHMMMRGMKMNIGCCCCRGC
jgi:hypothetical protein